MSKSKKFLFRAFVVLALFALISGGCGGSDNSSGGSSGTTSENASTENDDGTGRNVNGLGEQSVFKAISSRWICDSIKLQVANDVYYDTFFESEEGSTSPRFRFVTEDIWDNLYTFEIAPYESYPDTEAVFTEPVKRNFVSRTTNRRVNNIAVMDAGNFQEVGENTFMAQNPDTPDCYQMIILSGQKSEDNSYHEMEYQYVYSGENNTGYPRYSVVMKFYNVGTEFIEANSVFQKISSRYTLSSATLMLGDTETQYQSTTSPRYRLIAKDGMLNIADVNSASDTTNFITEPITLDFGLSNADADDFDHVVTLPVLQAGQFKRIATSPLTYMWESEDGTTSQQIILDGRKTNGEGWTFIRVIYMHNDDSGGALSEYTAELTLLNEE